MTSLMKHISDHIKKVPQIYTEKLIEEKLLEKGFKDSKFCKMVSKKIIAGEDGPFEFGDGADDVILLQITEEDKSRVLEKLNKFKEVELPKLINNIIKKGSEEIVKENFKNWEYKKLSERYELRHFIDRTDIRWSKGIDPLRMMLSASREIGEISAKRVKKSKAKSGIQKKQALLLLHVRACQTVLEIITLLENGLPDGAYARWRTLYEITVVAFFINKYGDDTAVQYIEHDAVSEHDAMMNWFKHNGIDFSYDALTDEGKIIEDDFISVVEKYGKPFESPYGWAATALGKKRPTLQNIEESVDWPALSPEFKWSSLKIHAGSSGVLRSLCGVGIRPIIHAGATNSGLHIPAISTASSLLQITTLLFPERNSLEVALQVNALSILRDKVIKECNKISEDLEKEEKAMNRN